MARNPKHPVQRNRLHGKYADAIYDLYDRRCHLCNRRHADTIDHIVPVAWGGSDHPANLKPACRSCNSSKGAARPARRTYTQPLMWIPGKGANVTGTINPPFGPVIGIRGLILWFGLAAAGYWWTTVQPGSPVDHAWYLFVVIPVVWNVMLVGWWFRSRTQFTKTAAANTDPVDPETWITWAAAGRPNPSESDHVWSDSP